MISFSRTPHNFAICDHAVIPFETRSNEDEIDAVARMILYRSQNGWEIVDVCGDEHGRPVMLFKKVPDPRIIPQYTIERLEFPSHKDELEEIKKRLWQRLAENWLPACVIDRPNHSPLLVFRKSQQPCSDKQVTLVKMSLDVSERPERALTQELFTQQIKNHMELACVIYGGFHPVLVMVSKNGPDHSQYLVDHSEGGQFTDHAKSLVELIDMRAAEGWEACGIFEDAFVFPCVIFNRCSDSLIQDQ
jgi:hypothetical protein